MGTDALDVLNELQLPLAREIRSRISATIQRLTPSIDALYVPDIDRSLDEETAKREFWRAFRVLGELVGRLPALLTSPQRSKAGQAPAVRCRAHDGRRSGGETLNLQHDLAELLRLRKALVAAGASSSG